MPLDQQTRRDRRQKMSRAVALGRTIREVAEYYGVSERLVADACQEFGTPRPTEPGKVRTTTLRIIAALWDRTRTYTEVSATYGVARHRVEQIYAQAVRAGIPIPKRPKRRRAKSGGLTAAKGGK